MEQQKIATFSGVDSKKTFYANYPMDLDNYQVVVYK